MLPQANATILLVARSGAVRDYETPAGDPATKWEGQLEAYLQEVSERVYVGQGTDIVKRRRLIVEADTPVEWEEGDQVTLVRAGETDEQAEAVRLVEPFRLPGLQGVIHLTLEDK